MKTRPSILIIKEDQLLTMRYNYGGQDVYNLPGGNVEFGEELEDSLGRELQEELGVKVEIGALHFVAEVHTKQMQNLHFVYRGFIQEGIPILNPKETSALEIVWLPIKNIDQYQLYPNIATYISSRPVKNHLFRCFGSKMALKKWKLN